MDQVCYLDVFEASGEAKISPTHKGKESYSRTSEMQGNAASCRSFRTGKGYVQMAGRLVRNQQILPRSCCCETHKFIQNREIPNQETGTEVWGKKKQNTVTVKHKLTATLDMILRWCTGNCTAVNMVLSSTSTLVCIFIMYSNIVLLLRINGL